MGHANWILCRGMNVRVSTKTWKVSTEKLMVRLVENLEIVEIKNFQNFEIVNNLQTIWKLLNPMETRRKTSLKIRLFFGGKNLKILKYWNANFSNFHNCILKILLDAGLFCLAASTKYGKVITGFIEMWNCWTHLRNHGETFQKWFRWHFWDSWKSSIIGDLEIAKCNGNWEKNKFEDPTHFSRRWKTWNIEIQNFQNFDILKILLDADFSVLRLPFAPRLL